MSYLSEPASMSVDPRTSDERGPVLEARVTRIIGDADDQEPQNSRPRNTSSLYGPKEVRDEVCVDEAE